MHGLLQLFTPIEIQAVRDVSYDYPLIQEAGERFWLTLMVYVFVQGID